MKTILKILLLFLFLLMTQRIFAQRLTDSMESMVLYSVKKCAERSYMYHVPCIFWNGESKPIYWAKLISLDKELKKWEVVFFQTDRKGLLTVKNFTEGIIVNTDRYLLLFEYDTLLDLESQNFFEAIDRSIFYEEESNRLKSLKENNEILGTSLLGSSLLYAKWCCIEHSSYTGKFSVYSKEMSPYNLLPDRLKVFELEELYSNLLIPENMFLNHCSGDFPKYSRKELREMKKSIMPRSLRTASGRLKITKDQQPAYDIERLRKINGKLRKWEKNGQEHYEFIEKYSF